ncbi:MULTISPECIES: hypothetical protein [unclassified Paenibacillus]|uniref:hypothetical protein n=1 Tax=unclassified Paenibacillus TaxID=185978 RepID=UPI002786C846|nr:MULTISPECIES: hypothetical protein [unclassified Paenibacillus]MDQ0902093.1 hypothetical protein [Paenibacillus sp. V4I7]MDQ0919413.1 hypothetical protein [Paenibacillus sp. V4I5]
MSLTTFASLPFQNVLAAGSPAFSCTAAAAGNPRFPKGKMWLLDDSPAVSLLLDTHEYAYEMKCAPRITRDMCYVHHQKERFIRWYNEVDARFTLEDMYAKIALFDAYKK